MRALRKKKMFDWFRRNQYEISYFIAGWCALAALNCFAKGDYLWMAVNGFLVYANIRISR